MALGAVVGLILTVAWLTHWSEPVFEARARLVQMPGTGAFRDAPNPDFNILTEAERLQTPALAGRVVDQLGLASLPQADGPFDRLRTRYLATRLDLAVVDARETATSTLLARLHVTASPESGILALTLRGPDPAVTADTLNALAETYLSDQLAAGTAASAATLRWLSTQVSTLREDLEAAETAAQAAKTTQGRSDNATLSVIERKLDALRMAAADPGIGAADRESLQADFVSLAAQVETANRDLTRTRQLEREASATELLYTHYLSRLKAASMLAAVPTARFEILTPASSSRAAIGPTAVYAVPLGTFGGLLVGVLFSMMSQTFPTRLTSSKAMSDTTGLPSLGTIPLIPAAQSGRVMQVLRGADDQLADALRNLRTSIHLTDLDSPPRVLMVASAQRGEGRSMMTLMLAQALSNWGKRVLVIEGDLHAPSLAKRLGHPGKPGLLSVLAGLSPPEVAASGVDGLPFDVLVAEPGSNTAPDIFGSERFNRFLTDMRLRYDHVLIDSPALLSVTDGRMIAPHVDGVLLLSRYGRTPAPLLRRAVARLDHPGIRLLGTVLMGAPRARHRRGI